MSFALGAALIMALAGTLVALAGPPLRPLPTASPAVRWFMHGASGFGIGWWVGLVWSVGLALHARRYQPPPPLTALTRATWIAAGVLVATTFAGLYLKVSFLGSAGAGVVAGTLAARVLVSRAAHRGQP